MFLKCLMGIALVQLVKFAAYNNLIDKQKTLDSEWWKTAVFYQIYPRSYKDLNNDGIGDLKGITTKLQYLKETGVTATWLSPIYKSPQVDQGYDISDYRDIDPDYGTLADFDAFIEEANKLGIKIIMDLVPNHSSDKHKWFELSENRTPGYEDYYVWADKNKTTGKEPNNWISVFKNSAWTWSNVRQQYYLHQFTPQQPDLNFNNPAVVKEMLDIMEFWFDRGVAGFRIDAVPHIFETGLEDEPRSNDPNAKEDEYNYLDHILTKDQDETFELVYTMREFVDNYSNKKGDYARVLMTECYTSMENIIRYYGDDDKNILGAHFSFNFFLFDIKKDSNAYDIVKIINNWLWNLPKQYVFNWVLGNHDNHRVATRLGVENVDAYNMLIGILPGVGVTYNGEEIGQENGHVSYAEGVDPSGCNGDEEHYLQNSRDFERTPFHWEPTTNAGFNTGAKPWLPVSQKYLSNNLARQKVQGSKSHYNVYKDLQKLRQEITLKDGNVLVDAVNQNVLYIKRDLENHKTYVFIFNRSDNLETVDLSKDLPSTVTWKVSLASVNSNRNTGDVISINKLALNAHESIIIEA